MTRFLILHLALVGALLALAATTPAARGAAIVVTGTDAIELAKRGKWDYGGGKYGGDKYGGDKHGGDKYGGNKGDFRKYDIVKHDGVTHVDRIRRAVRSDDIYAEKAFAENEGAVPKDRVRGKIAKGANRDDLKESLARDDGKMRVDLVRRAARDDVVHAKKTLAKGVDVEARVDRIKSQSGKKALPKNDDVTRATLPRRAVGRDEIRTKKAYVKDGDVEARVGRIKSQSGKGVDRDDIKKALVKNDDVTRATLPRRAVGRDEIRTKKAYVKDDDVVHKDGFKDDGEVRKDRIKAGRITGSIKADE
ncbi:hypothetical protein GGF31_003622 [Allomyces arbusculus]|nr:hypothetical protein GGF31_003622 [Allomyces arbusculus]